MDLWLIKKFITDALREDIGEEDITTQILVSPDLSYRKAKIVAKSTGILAGIEIAREIFHFLCPDTIFGNSYKDGDKFNSGDTLLELEASPQAILKGERVALNFLQRLSGIATLTGKFVKIVSPYGVKILDTRKTTPNLRLLEKYAVRVGGGLNHRINLSSGIIIKDNHIKIVGGLDKAIKIAKQKAPPFTKIEVEISNLDELKYIIENKVDMVMLDNFSYQELKEAIKTIRNKSRQTLIEVSGGVTLENAEKIAKLKPDFISVGGLTHSAAGVDISLEVI